MTLARLVASAAVLVLLVGPLVAIVAGVSRARRRAATMAHGGIGWNRNLTASSALLYVLAFNLTFFVQELFLVLPKAFVPGLNPTLYHNNHRWDGDDPLAALLQGTGALAILGSGVICALLLRRGQRKTTISLFLVWMTFNGFFQALPQVCIGALHSGSDVGMAMDYLGFSSGARLVAAITALLAIPLVSRWLTRRLLETAGEPGHVAGARARARFVFRVATVPALLAIPLIVPFRVPRELVEVVMPPVVVTSIGLLWMQAWAWHADEVTAGGDTAPRSLAVLCAAVLALLFVFQVLLRPGVPFY